MEITQMKKAIFLDRDGVLNDAIIKNGKPYPPSSLEELRISIDAKQALTMLKSAGFLLIGATNQPDVAKGKTPKSLIEMINAQLMAELPLDEIRVCFHEDKDQCDCRKPLPGLLTKAAQHHGINLSNSVMIGDRWRDIEAGQHAGCKTIWIKQSYQEKQPENYDYAATTLLDAANWIISTQ
jgi:D-glycero-D-manno-heptose 1,7-bisphosphate phosphatase